MGMGFTKSMFVLALGLSSNEIWSEIKSDITNKFPYLTAYQVDEIDKVLFKQSEIWLDGQHKVLRLIIIIIIILGIFNATSTAVFGRKKEVGILKANGESVFEIIQQFMIEIFIISVLATSMGVSLVFIICQLIASLGGIVMPPGPGYTDHFIVIIKTSSSSSLMTLLICLSCSLLATIFATYKTANLSTIKALKGI